MLELKLTEEIKKGKKCWVVRLGAASWTFYDEKKAKDFKEHFHVTSVKC